MGEKCCQNQQSTPNSAILIKCLSRRPPCPHSLGTDTFFNSTFANFWFHNILPQASKLGTYFEPEHFVWTSNLVKSNHPFSSNRESKFLLELQIWSHRVIPLALLPIIGTWNFSWRTEAICVDFTFGHIQSFLPPSWN